MATANTTRTVTVNAAFLQEIKEVNQDLWRLLADVRRMCDTPATIDSAPRRFFGLVEELRDQLALHFALEEPTATSTIRSTWHRDCADKPTSCEPNMTSCI